MWKMAAFLCHSPRLFAKSTIYQVNFKINFVISTISSEILIIFASY